MALHFLVGIRSGERSIELCELSLAEHQGEHAERERSWAAVWRSCSATENRFSSSSRRFTISAASLTLLVMIDALEQGVVQSLVDDAVAVLIEPENLESVAAFARKHE